MAKVLIGIPTRNRPEHLAKCLDSLLQQTFQDYDVIVVDDSDTFVDPRTHFRFGPIINALQSKGHNWYWIPGKHLGPQYGHQTVLESAKTELVWRVDDDTEADPNTLQLLHDTLMSDNDAAAVAPLILVPGVGNGQFIPAGECAKYGKVNEYGEPDGTMQWIHHADLNPKPAQHLHCSFLYKTDAMRKVGGWFLGYSRAGHREETDVTYRLFCAGYKLLVVPLAVLRHNRASFGGIRDVVAADYASDDAIWKGRFQAMKGERKGVAVCIDGGIGDHLAALPAVMEMKRIHGDKLSIFACYEFVMAATGIKTESLGKYNSAEPWMERHPENVYAWGSRTSFTGTLSEAYDMKILGRKAPRPSLKFASTPVEGVKRPFVLISPVAGNNLTLNRTEGPKNWIHERWESLVNEIDTPVVQIGRGTEKQVAGAQFLPDLKFEQVVWLLENCEYFIGADNFVHHLANILGRRGVVLFACSDSKIYSNQFNINIAGSRKCNQECHQGTSAQCQWWLHDRECQHDRICATSIPVSMVLSEINGFRPDTLKTKRQRASIVIPTYNHLEDCLKPCLESIKRNTNLVDAEVIVVANGCTDGTKEYLDTQKWVKTLWYDKPLGFAPAINAGIKAAKGDYIILMNNDVKVLDWAGHNQWLCELLAPFRRASVGLTGTLKLPSGITKRRFIVFFLVAIKREVFEKIGYLDEDFKVGAGEDTLFCFLAENAGYELVQVPNDAPLSQKDNTNVSTFPVYHKAEATMHDEKCVTDWKQTFDANTELLRKKVELLNRTIEASAPVKLDLEGLEKQDKPTFGEVFTHNTYKVSKNDVADKNVLDVGANRGFFSLLCVSLGSRKVVAVEANPGIFEAGLTPNVASYPSIVTVNHAVLDADGKTVNINDDEVRSSIYSGSGKQVSTITIKSLLKHFPDNDNNLVLKMDCEGAEYDILLNIDKDTLRRFKTVFLEAHRCIHPKYKDTKVIVDMFKDAGYEVVNHEHMYVWNIDNHGNRVNQRILNDIIKLTRKECDNAVVGSSRRPFLSIVTRTHKRPKQLLRCLESISKMTDDDYENVLIVDGNEKSDVVRANKLFSGNKNRVRGEYVLMLYDDNVLVDYDLVKELKKAINDSKPSVVMVKVEHQGTKILPEPELWKKPPVQAHVDTANVIVRRDVWMKHIDVFGKEYIGDFRFVEELHKTGYDFTWLDRVAVSIPVQHFGKIGE